LTDYHINDDWILKRVMNESSSFSQWIHELMNTVEKSLEAENPEAAEKFRKERDLKKLKIDEKFMDMDKKLTESMEKLSGMGSLGDFISHKVTSIIEKGLVTVGHDLDMNVDFITGKRKSLASALYDVTRERGIDSEGILYLIRALPDFESFLYSTSVKKYYRDHTEHQLRVAVLGDFLLEQDLEQGVLLKIIAELTETDENLIKDKIWWVTGLIHDIGYPLSKMTTAVNWSLVNQILKCYPHLDLQVVPMEISLLNDSAQREYVAMLEEGLSKEARALIRRGAGFNCESVPVPEAQTFWSEEKGHPEFTFTSKIGLDHGVIGAVNLLKSLGTPEEIKENIDEYTGYLMAAQAIALHNFKERLKDFTFDENPLAFFLVLIDEMQEWGRPIPIQIRDSYFTTELKTATLLDEIILTIDEFEWIMQYWNSKAKQLIKFDFGRLCKGKKEAFFRLDRGEKFQKTTILLQDYEDEVERIPEGGKQLRPHVSEKRKRRSLSLRKSEKQIPAKRILDEFQILI
jgi:hypothetical protein